MCDPSLQALRMTRAQEFLTQAETQVGERGRGRGDVGHPERADGDGDGFVPAAPIKKAPRLLPEPRGHP